uniref:Putative secreted protein n=1 Tax=Anopheles darlingi TaxID=43151 RepID=A0A2M4D3T9_ANODA
MSAEVCVCVYVLMAASCVFARETVTLSSTSFFPVVCCVVPAFLYTDRPIERTTAPFNCTAHTTQGGGMHRYRTLEE